MSKTLNRVVGLAALIYVVGLLPAPSLHFYEQLPPLSRLLRMDAGVAAQVNNPRPLIKSVQRGTTTMATSAVTNTTTITSVVLANSRIKYLGFRSDAVGDGGTSPAYLMCRVELTNATTVSVFRDQSDNTYGRIVSWEVIEYFPGVIRAVQRGYIDMTTNTSATATLSPAVVLAKSELDYLGNITKYGTSSNNIYSATVVLTNTTTVTATVPNAAGAMHVGWQVTQFQP